MSKSSALRYPDLLEQRKRSIIEALEEYLDKPIAPAKSLELKRAFAKLYAADIADMFEVIGPELRQFAWQYITVENLTAIIDEMSEASGIAVVGELSDELLAQALKSGKDIEHAECVLRYLPPQRRSELIQLTGLHTHEVLMRSLLFAPGTVGMIMDYSHISITSKLTLGVLADQTRQRKSLPPHFDKFFVTEQKKLIGVLPLKKILLNDQASQVSQVMVSERLHTLRADDTIASAIQLFERYDLISAPIIDRNYQLIGRLTIDEIVHQMHDDQSSHLLTTTGVQEDEDLFAPIWRRLQNRSLWIFINLFAAFVVSRLIGLFEATIVEVVALASLMPIIASMAGNTSMQTATVVIRALALNQLQLQNWYHMLSRELMLGVVNGAFWGGLSGLISMLFYQDLVLAFVLCVSMLIVFVLSAMAGFLIPIVVKKLRGDPALGTSVLVTTFTDSVGFVIFLGLASILLI